MSTVIIQKPHYPALLLSPSGSRDRSGPVTPAVGTDVSVVQGEYGSAWKATNGRTAQSFVSYSLGSLTTAPTPQEGTVILRASGFDPGLSSNQYLFRLGGVTVAPSLYLQGVGGNLRFTQNATGTPTYSTIAPLPTNTPFIVVIRWSNGTATVRLIHAGGDTSQVVALGTFTHTAFPDVSTTLSTLNSSVAFESIVLFADALTDTETERFLSSESMWTWASVGQYVLRPEEVTITTPAQAGSRVSHVETVVYETDRNNAPGVELSGITSVDVDWDIDRAGSKARIDITTHKRVLRDGMWIAPYLRITPEVGEVQYQQMGHFRLGLPTTVTDGSVDTFGDDKVEQSATGTDIVDLLADASLPFTFTTPRQGHINSEIIALIRMATCGGMGPNLIPNRSFEDEGDGWLTAFTNGGSGTLAYTRPNSSWDYPDGLRVFRTTFSTANPVNGASYATNTSPDLIAIPPGARYLYMGGQARTSSSVSMYMQIQFHNASGAVISSATVTSRPMTATMPDAMWIRHFTVAEVPENAASFRLWLFSIDRIGGRTVSAVWDDIRVGTCTQMPLPDRRIRLPGSNAVASTRIQTTGGNSIGYDAINADRLAAIGHHAIYTDLTGRLTSSPSRDLGSATVSRTYQEDDYRFVGATEVQRSASNRYNTVTAVKESFEEGVEPLVVTVFNNDANDPWSVHHLGNVRYPNGPLMVQDAVDEAALESAAMATLARATEQHTLRIQVLPDPTLAVHDVIEIIGGPEEAQGRWLVEYLRPGTSAGDPIVEIGARRTLASVEVSNE